MKSDLGLRVEVISDPQAAVDGADLICTTTSAREPVLFGASIAKGAHINAVGACFAGTRELDTAAVVKSRSTSIDGSRRWPSRAIS